MDSLPFRFGLHFKRDLILDVFDVAGWRPDAQENGRFHVDASFRDPDLPNALIHRGHFVLLEGALPKVVTVWRTDDTATETYLSELIRNLRRDRVVTVADLLKLHPDHVSGRLRTAAQLFARLVADRTEADRAQLEAAEKRAQTDAQRILNDLEDAKRTAVVAEERAQHEAAGRQRAEMEKHEAEQVAYSQVQMASELQGVVAERDAQIAQLQKELMDERRAARDEGMSLVIAKPDTLVAVNENVLYARTSCTELVMGDSTRLYMKTSTFDRLGRVTAKAQNLIGKRVKTTCWDPYEKPGYWSSRGYFRNLYPALE
jgi:hypothetical protein